MSIQFYPHFASISSAQALRKDAVVVGRLKWGGESPPLKPH